jgi:glycosyltransferase involved in cell wall biosynthesis
VRVLRASPRTAPLLGGQEIHVAELTRELADVGIDQLLCYAEGGGTSAPGINSVQLRRPSMGGNILRDAFFGMRLLVPARRWRPDVVHTHGDSPVARGGARAADHSSAVHVHTFHGSIVPDPPRATILSWMLPRSSWYLTVSSDIRVQLIAAGISPEKIRVRTSGVRYPFIEASASLRAPVAVIGGRLASVRRILEFVTAWCSADIDDVRLVVFGAGPEEGVIRRLSSANPSVDWHGSLSASRLASLLAAASVGLVLTKPGVSEGTPTLALEMLAAGCFPIVASGTGDAPSLVGELGFGMVCDGLPDPSWVAQLARNNVSGLATERQAARELIRVSYSWQAVAQDVRALYERALGREE